MVTLRPITKENWQTAALMELPEPQRDWVAPNAYSICEALYEPDTRFAYGVYVGETMVGFVMLAYEPERQRDWIARLMIATEHQRKGYGRAALQAAIDLLRRAGRTDSVYIGFMPANAVARGLYESFGFLDLNQMEDGEHIFRLSLTPAPE